MFSVQSRLLSTVSKAKFCCPGFLSDMHTHTRFSHPTKRRRNCRDWWQDEVVILSSWKDERSWEEPRWALVTSKMCKGARGKRPSDLIQTCAAFPASIFPSFQPQAFQLLPTALPGTADPALTTSHCTSQTPILRNWLYSCASGATGGKGTSRRRQNKPNPFVLLRQSLAQSNFLSLTEQCCTERAVVISLINCTLFYLELTLGFPARGGRQRNCSENPQGRTVLPWLASSSCPVLVKH